jgi:acyl-CoA thioester hydrolase
MSELTAAKVPFHIVVRVYWEDTDAGGVVFYANYLKYFERARTEWLRSLGVEQNSLHELTGALFVVSSTQVRYLQPARLDDCLQVSAAVCQQGRASLTFKQQALRGSELLTDGEIRVGCVDSRTFQPRRMPAALLDRLAS